MTDQTAANATDVGAVNKKTPWALILILLAAALVALWSTGRMDTLLVNVGLNKNDCVKNAFGATFCGSDATRYQQQIGAITSGAGASDSPAADDYSGQMPNVHIGDSLAATKDYLGAPDKTQRTVTAYAGVRSVSLYLYYGNWQLSFENGKLVAKSSY